MDREFRRFYKQKSVENSSKIQIQNSNKLAQNDDIYFCDLKLT
jgi:hypothetical protein